MSTVGELACSYAVMILEDEGIAITSDKIATIVKASGVEIESYWPMLFAKMAEKRNVTDLIMNVGAGGGGGGAPVAAAAPAAAGGAAAAAPAKEEKKDEPAEESDGDLGFGLFD
ncbi:60S acidic ribosomal protein P1-2 [Raphanus sativus]|uniref:60S acidic ribosomal protein P1-2 n=1 Tax=Raphanus sativus TaxID=3726 RepID=A0A6J0MR63_RAPSA|nr:60S acidic ribosomal protein P1-2 [Raphanus sativus]XP_018474394.1 60S acidic ribosomal protein P1-2 [Raphanus sativus]KAJ4905529.1 60S acidic ribosomal protein P1-2 [Raphanus sativus]KAJ4905542.1 60S acidic ribosomal protein P1-2 [Raphanus sativus]